MEVYSSPPLYILELEIFLPINLGFYAKYFHKISLSLQQALY